MLSVPDLLSPVLKRFWLIVGCALLMAVLFVLLSRFIDPTYRTSATIAPISNGSSMQLSGNSALGQVSRLLDVGGFGQGDFSRDAFGVLNSDALVARFISRKDILSTVTEYEAESDRKPPMLVEGVSVFKESLLGIDEDQFSGLITISIDWNDRDEAVEWTNEFIALANEVVRERTITNAKSGNEYLLAELDSHSSVELRQAIFGLMENNIKMTMLATTREEFAFTVIDPAVAPAEDDYIWPNRLLLAVLGAVVGGALAISLVLFSHFRRQRPSQKFSN